MVNSLIAFLRNLNPDFVKLLKGSGLVMGFKVLGALAGYALAYVITTRYGAESFGIFELSLTFITIVGVLGRLGLDSALVRFIPEFQEKGAFNLMRSAYRFALGIALPISFALAGLLYLGADTLASFFGTPDLADDFRITSFIIPLSTWMGLNSESLRGMKNMVAYSFYQSGTVVLIAVLVIYILEATGSQSTHIPLIAFGVGVGILAVSAGLFTPYKLFRLGSFESIDSENKFQPKDLLKVAFPMLLSTSMFMVMNWTDTLMIGYYLEKSDIGIYRLAFKVAALITFAQFAISSIAAPMFSSFKAKGDMSGLKRITRNIGYLNILISVPIFVFVLIFPSYVLAFFGEEFLSGAEPLIILAVGSIFNALCGPVMYLLTMTGKEKPARNIIITASVLNVILNLYLIPDYGLLGAAYSTTISTVVWNFLAVIQVKKEYGFISFANPFSK